VFTAEPLGNYVKFIKVPACTIAEFIFVL